MAAPHPVSVVEMDLKTYVKFLVDQLATEQLQPMQMQLKLLSQAVLGNGVPPLAQQIADVDKKHTDEAAILHKRITDLLAKPEDPDEKQNTETRLMLKGFGIGIAALGSFVTVLIEVFRVLPHH